MKKIYVSFLLDLIVFDEMDTIRTSGFVGATVTEDFTETGANFNDYFGEG